MRARALARVVMHKRALPMIHIIASCSSTKTLPTPRARQFGDIARHASDRLELWRHRLEVGVAAERVVAKDLYAGQHWSVARGLPEEAAAAAWAPSLWIASAGLGLVNASDIVPAYSATFARRQQDSVATEPEAARAWWESLGHLGRARGGPGSVRALARQYPQATILVLASPPYIAALRDDLIAAGKELQRPDRLVILSSRGASTSSLAESVVELSGSLRLVLGGGLVSLHARAARHALRLVRPPDFTRTVLKEFFRRTEGRTSEMRIETYPTALPQLRESAEATTTRPPHALGARRQAGSSASIQSSEALGRRA